MEKGVKALLWGYGVRSFSSTMQCAAVRTKPPGMSTPCEPRRGNVTSTIPNINLLFHGA